MSALLVLGLAACQGPNTTPATSTIPPLPPTPDLPRPDLPTQPGFPPLPPTPPAPPSPPALTPRPGTAPPPNTGPTPSTNGAATPSSDGALSPDMQRLVDQARADAASATGRPAADWRVVRVESVDWPDSALGCPQPSRAYLQVITPGYRIVLTNGDTTLEYHTDQRGTVVKC